MSKILGASVYVPSRASKDKARLSVLRCSLDDGSNCPLLMKGQCIEVGAWLSYGCIYGRIDQTVGYTQRAYKFSEKVREFRARRDEYGPMPERAPKRMAKIGKFVWLPYPHIDMCKFVTGCPFVLIENFTPEVIVALAKFRPLALMGGVIQSYQAKSVPVFLFHLKQDEPDLYAQAAALDDIILSKAFTLANLGGKATVKVKDVSPGTEVTVRKWKGIWDGKEIVFTQADSSHIIGLYNSEIAELSIQLLPAEGVTVTIEDKEEISRLWNEGKIIVES